MNLSLFQRLVLLALAELIAMVGNRAQYGRLAELLRNVALGKYTQAQQESMWEEHKRSIAR